MGKLRLRAQRLKKFGVRNVGLSIGRTFIEFSRAADEYVAFVTVCLWWVVIDISYAYSKRWKRRA